MNLQERFDQAKKRVEEVNEERELLEATLAAAQNNLDNNTMQLRRAIRERDETSAALSVAPPPRKVHASEEAMLDKQRVFAAIRQVPNMWIMPAGLAVMSGVDDDVTAAILRRAAKLDGIPVEHNGRRGRASMYRWVDTSNKE